MRIISKLAHVHNSLTIQQLFLYNEDTGVLSVKGEDLFFNQAEQKLNRIPLLDTHVPAKTLEEVLCELESLGYSRDKIDTSGIQLTYIPTKLTA